MGVIESVISLENARLSKFLPHLKSNLLKLLPSSFEFFINFFVTLSRVVINYK